MAVSQEGINSLYSVPVEEALDRFLTELEYQEAANPLEHEMVELEHALDRITAEPVVAKMSSPHFYAAAIDGMMVRAAETLNASPEDPVRIPLADHLFVETGSPIADGFDAVVPFHELTLEEEGGRVRLERPSSPWRNIRPIGEDIAANELVLPRDHRIQPLDLGALVASGAAQIKVYRRPKVAVITLGNKLVEPGTKPEVGEMLDSNTLILCGLVTESDALPSRRPPVPENLEQAGLALRAAATESDLVLVAAGPSHGTALLARVFDNLGDCILHGVALKPGHSLALGVIEQTPVIGLPYHPGSGFLSFALFAKPILARLTGRPVDHSPWPTEKAVVALETGSGHGVEEFIRVRLGKVDDRTVAVPDSSGSPTLMSMIRADGLLRVPAEANRIEVGSVVEVYRLEPERSLEGNLLLLGTHNICYHVIRNLLQRSFPDVRLHSAATGGSAGLRCLQGGNCHMAAIHLFDEPTGTYNIPFLEREMAGEPMILIHLLKRYLGLAVKSGNPLGIESLADLTRPEVRFINRQPGSGTRALVDFHLAKLEVDSTKINGFDQEVRTHMAVAAAVAGDLADAGPSVSTAARALRLDFVPAISERLELAIPKRFWNHYPVRALRKVIRSKVFQQEAAKQLTDYDFTETGEVIWEST